jgi:uncharacterized protein YajQ (UPF0234 family)
MVRPITGQNIQLVFKLLNWKLSQEKEMGTKNASS